MLQTSWGFATLPFDLWGKPHDHLETRVVGGAILTNVKPREANKNQAISQPFRFPGQYEDEETGLYYNRYRYYMPNEGIYTQRDPIGLAGGNPTVYGYVFDTLKHTDPFGLRCTGKPKNNTLSDDANVVRGGTNKPEQFTNGSGVTTGADGNLNGVSVNSANGLSVDNLSNGIPNGKVGTTTVGAIRDLGGDVTPSPTLNNPHHATLSGITANQASSLFNPIIPNPSKIK